MLELRFITQDKYDDDCIQLLKSMHRNVDAAIKLFKTCHEHIMKELGMIQSCADPCAFFKGDDKDKVIFE